MESLSALKGVFTVLKGAAKPVIRLAEFFGTRLLYTSETRKRLDAKATQTYAEAAKIYAEAIETISRSRATDEQTRRTYAETLRTTVVLLKECGVTDDQISVLLRDGIDRFLRMADSVELLDHAIRERKIIDIRVIPDPPRMLTEKAPVIAKSEADIGTPNTATADKNGPPSEPHTE